MTPPAPPSSKHLKPLDGLRGLAILLVVLYHGLPHRGMGLFGYLASAGWCGVDLFFVLSGFLITGILYDTQGTPDFYRSFYARRILRLTPIYLVFLLVVFLFPHPPNGHPWWVTVAFVAYASNIVLFFIPSFQFGAPLTTIHIWSLSVEEQFYLLWPWLVTRLRTRRRIAIACAAGSLAALTLRFVLLHLALPNTIFLYYELPTRADALLLGAAAAMLYRTPTLLARILPILRILAPLAAVAFLCAAYQAQTFFFAAPPIDLWGYTCLALVAVSLLLLATVPGSLTARLFSNPALRFFGRYSYGLYLIYQLPEAYTAEHLLPILAARLHPFWFAGTAYLLLTLAPAVALAILSFHFVEQPFLRLKKRFPQQTPPSLNLSSQPPITIPARSI